MTTPPAPCPHCQKNDPQEIKFTWWGGILGPKILHHGRCLQCRKTYNLKTGRPNDTAILIYTLVGFLLVGILAFAAIIGGLFKF